MAYQTWTREQDLAVLYAKLEYGQQFRIHPDITRLADAIGHSEDSVGMRVRNFDWLDQSVPGGLSNAASLTRKIWNEYERNPKQVFREAREAYQKLLTRA